MTAGKRLFSCESLIAEGDWILRLRGLTAVLLWYGDEPFLLYDG
jgi:hypothetical protein